MYHKTHNTQGVDPCKECMGSTPLCLVVQGTSGTKDVIPFLLMLFKLVVEDLFSETISSGPLPLGSNVPLRLEQARARNIMDSKTKNTKNHFFSECVPTLTSMEYCGTRWEWTRGYGSFIFHHLK